MRIQQKILELENAIAEQQSKSQDAHQIEFLEKMLKVVRNLDGSFNKLEIDDNIPNDTYRLDQVQDAAWFAQEFAG